MENWEDILAGYLEGMESRADAEALRWKIHLAVEVREEVEAVLRLADEVAAAVGSAAVPDGAVSRLQRVLREQPDWNGRAVPAAWWHARDGFQRRPLSAPPAAGAAGVSMAAGREDAINEMIEGTAPMVPAAVPAAAAVPAGAARETANAGTATDRMVSDDELEGRLEQVQSLAAGLSDLARRRPPEGAVDRLLSRFREDVGQADGVDEEAARQFMDRLKTGSPRRAELPVTPDVLAASAETGEPNVVPPGGESGTTKTDPGPKDPA